MLAAAVHALKGLFGQQADQAVLFGDLLHHLHGQQVVVHGDVGGVKDGGQLMLAGGNLVVLGLGGNPQFPQLVVQILHIFGDDGPQGAEVMLLQLLALGGHGTEQGAAGEDQILTGLIVLFANQEVLLLGTHGGGHMVHLLAEQLQDAAGLGGQGAHGAQQRGFFIQCLAVVAAERGGDAQHTVLHEGVAGGVPRGVAAGFAGGAQAAIGEGRSIGLALDQLFAVELHDGGAVFHGADETIVLLTGDAGERLEPVGVMGGAHLHRPALHHAGNHIGHFNVQRLTLFQGGLQAFISSAGQAFFHHVLVEYVLAVDLHYIRCHILTPSQSSRLEGFPTLLPDDPQRGAACL